MLEWLSSVEMMATNEPMERYRNHESSGLGCGAGFARPDASGRGPGPLSSASGKGDGSGNGFANIDGGSNTHPETPDGHGGSVNFETFARTWSTAQHLALTSDLEQLPQGLRIDGSRDELEVVRDYALDLDLPSLLARLEGRRL